MRATIKGRDVAEKDFKAVAAYAAAKLSLSEKATKDQWDTNIRPMAIDKVYYDDFCSLSRWAQGEKATEGKIDYNGLTWGDGLKSINPKTGGLPLRRPADHTQYRSHAGSRPACFLIAEATSKVKSYDVHHRRLEAL